MSKSKHSLRKRASGWFHLDDLEIARRYISKADRAVKEGYEFTLSFISYKNMMNAKKCKVTGMSLTTPRPSKCIRFTDRTIDRLDNRKGYVTGNVVAMCSGANNLKSMFEDKGNALTPAMAIKIAEFTNACR